MGVGEIYLLFVAVLVLSVVLFLFSITNLLHCVALNKDKEHFFECVKYFRISENKFMYFTGSLLLSSLMIMMMTNYYARNMFMNILKKESPLEIVVDGISLRGEEKSKFIKDSLNIYTRKGRSGSHPVRVQKVSLTSEESKHTYFYQQDSRDGHMYWVYLPSELVKIKIGFVETSAINQISD